MAPPCISSDRARSWRRLVLKVLGHPWFATLVWSMFLLLTLVMVGINVVLRTWGIGTFATTTARIERWGKLGVFNITPLIDAEGKPSFLQYARTPAGRFLHILPTGLWSVIAPLQISPAFRRRYPASHRWLGRLFMFMSAIMSIGIVPLVFSGAGKFGHSIFEGGVMLTSGTYFFVVGFIAVRHARNKKYAAHRMWMLRHVAFGYGVHLQRVLGVLSWWIYPLIIPGYSDLTEEGSDKRTRVFGIYFAACVLLNAGLMEVWLRYTSPSGKPVPLEEGQGGKATKAD